MTRKLLLLSISVLVRSSMDIFNCIYSLLLIVDLSSNAQTISESAVSAIPELLLQAPKLIFEEISLEESILKIVSFFK